MESTTPEPTEYIARFGFDRRTLLTLLGSVAFMIGLIWVPIEADARYPIAVQYAIKVLGIPVSGAAALMVGGRAARGGEALRVDRHGITLGSPRPPRRGWTSRPLRVAWTEVTAVVLFDQPVMVRGFTYQLGYISVRLQPDAQVTATTLDVGSRQWVTIRRTLRHIPEDILVRSRPVQGWRLDERRLCEAVARYAPDVHILRLDRTGTAQPVGVT